MAKERAILCLPDATFGETAAILVALASQEAMGIEELEVLLARQRPGSQEEAVFARSLADARRTAEVLAAWQALLRALAPHEAAVRAFLSDLDQRASAA